MEGGVRPNDEFEECLVGETLDHWLLVRVLGHGGMCTVYEAREPDGSRVAVKILNPALARRPRARARFLREGRVATAVGHPNAVRVLDSRAADGRLFLVMELLAGETLRQRCDASGGRLPAGEVLRVAARVLEVLAAAHAKSIFHRDIKPENVFVTLDGTVKVLDFGIAAVRDEALEEDPITQSGASLGTPAFMAPEQARGRHSQVDARTDLWAVGATMFVCLSGRHVHSDAGTANEALILSATRPPPPLATFCPDIPAAVAQIVDRALALDPAQRWGSADAMREAIAHAATAAKAALERAGAELARDATLDDTLAARSLLLEKPGGRRWPAVAAVLTFVGGGLIASELVMAVGPGRYAHGFRPYGGASSLPSASAAPATAGPGPTSSACAAVVSPSLAKPLASGVGAPSPGASPPAAGVAPARVAPVRVARGALGTAALSAPIPDAILDRRK
jgi:eukaryotic-like serine/threonine-protein kinase